MEFDERLLQQDGELQQLDFNENSRTLTTNNQEIHARTDQLSAISAFSMDLPVPPGVQASSATSETKTQPDLPPIIDDTLNNDFFYDEEFTIPFDANLVEDCRSLPADVDSLLRKILPAGDGNLEWQHAKMASSKSDSCLYQADQELSDSEREMSMSDHDGSNSSHNSPLQNQSLFSSCGEPGCDDASICHAEISDSVMSGSLSKDPDKYNYDYSEGKQQYILLFDRSPTKTCSSEDESCFPAADGRNRSKITSWLKTKPAKLRLKDEDSDCDPSPVIKVERERRTNSGLTTWGQVKSQQQVRDVQENGLTTWQQVKELQSSSFRSALAVARGLAAQKDERRMDTVFEELSSPPSSAANTVLEAETASDDVCQSRKLLNFYCRLKSHEEMNEFENNEGMASPLSAEKLVDPWSESLLAGDAGKIIEALHGSSRGIPVLWNEAQGVGMRKQDGKAGDVIAPPVEPGKDVSAKPPDQNTNAEQAGSPVLTASLLRCHDTVDCSMQFPPASMDCSVQTSFQFSSNQSSLTESKAQQTSVIASVALPPNNPPADNANSVKLENKMVRSAHLLSRPLPDLSFLNKSANQTSGKNENVCKSAKNESKNTKVKQSSKTSSQDSARGCSRTIRRSADPKASSSSDSRESSPNPVLYRNRSRSSDSTSTYSVCSTSSSGIDPGFCDSSGSGTRTPRQSRIFEETTRVTNFQAVESPKIPPKPPRIFATNSKNHPSDKTLDDTNLSKLETKNKRDNDNVIGICNVCNSQILSGKLNAKNLVTSHPTYYRETRDRSSTTKQFDYLHISPTHSRSRIFSDSSPSVVVRMSHDSLTRRHGSPRLSHGKEHVVMRSNQQQTPKPAKSILVRRRQRNQAKHRSWSNPSCEFDDLEPQRGYLPSYLVSEGRPLSLPDENLLHQTPSNVVEEPAEAPTSCRLEDEDLKEPQVAEDEVPDEGNEIDDEDCDYERFKAKKSVSFSEKIFYHSTSATNSPLDSPKCPQVELINSPNSPKQTTSTSLAIPKQSVECKALVVNVNNFKKEMHDSDLPPTDFIVSPNVSPSSSLSSSDSALSTDILHKRELVFDVMRAVEVLVKHFSQTRDATKKVQLGSTVENADVGRLVLEHLCPAVHAIVLDGLKPHVNSLFGKVKNSAYKVMEDSAELGQPVELIQDLVKSLKSLKFLNTPWVVFNAFIFGLLNYKALDFWLTYIHNHKLLLAKHYTSSSFIHLGNSAAHRLFLDMITSLQPLAQMPFRLEYSFETRLLERRQQEQLAEYVLDRHVSRSVETYIEGQQFLAQLHNLSSSQQALQRDELLAGATESKLKQRTKELWQKTQRQLVEKLSQSKERITSESTSLVRNVARATVIRRPRPMSFPMTSQSDVSSYGNMLQNVGFVRSLSRVESMDLMEDGNDGQLVESSGSDSDGGFFMRVAKQLKDMGLKEKVYKKGTTDYSFEESILVSSTLQKIDERSENFPSGDEIKSDGNLTSETKSEVATSRSSNGNSIQTTSVFPSSDVMFDANRVKTSLLNAALTHAQNNRLSTAAESTNSPPGVNMRNPSISMSPRNLGKNISNLHSSADSACSSDAAIVNSIKPSCESASSSPKLVDSSRLNGSASKKRWSDIGSHIVNIFDRLLLSSDSKVTSSAPSFVTSSSVVKCSSVGQINVPWLNDVHGSKVRHLSSSVGGSHFVRASSLDSAKHDAKPKTVESPTSKCQRRVLTLCHYVATDSHQLSFEKGTSMVILQDCNAEWKLCRLGQSVGLVHNACIRADDSGGSGATRPNSMK